MACRDAGYRAPLSRPLTALPHATKPFWANDTVDGFWCKYDDTCTFAHVDKAEVALHVYKRHLDGAENDSKDVRKKLLADEQILAHVFDGGVEALPVTMPRVFVRVQRDLTRTSAPIAASASGAGAADDEWSSTTETASHDTTSIASMLVDLEKDAIDETRRNEMIRMQAKLSSLNNGSNVGAAIASETFAKTSLFFLSKNELDETIVGGCRNDAYRIAPLMHMRIGLSVDAGAGLAADDNGIGAQTLQWLSAERHLTAAAALFYVARVVC